MIDPVPEDFHTITPQLVVNGVGGAIEWYTRALGAHELLRTWRLDGTSIMPSCCWETHASSSSTNFRGRWPRRRPWATRP